MYRKLRFMLFGVLLLSTLVLVGIMSPVASAAGGENANRNANVGITATKNTNVNVNIMAMGKMPSKQGQQSGEQQGQQGRQGQQPSGQQGQQAGSTNSNATFEQGLEGLLSGSW